MQEAMVCAFVVIAVAPLVGIWRGHAWAKTNGLVLRTVKVSSEHGKQTV